MSLKFMLLLCLLLVCTFLDKVLDQKGKHQVFLMYVVLV